MFYRNAMIGKKLEKGWQWGLKLKSITAWDTQTAPGRNPAFIHDFKVVRNINNLKH